MDGAPARGLPPRTPDKVEVPPARSPSSPSARCEGQAGAPRWGRDRPVYARRAEALRRHRPLVRRAGGQGRDACRRANRREADRRDRPPSEATPPPARRVAMPAGRSPPATGRSGVQTTPRPTASTQTALHRCRLSADPQSSGQISAGHRRCGRRRWAEVSVDGRAPGGGEITYADCGRVAKTLSSLWFVYTVCIGGTCGGPSWRHGTGTAWRWVYGRAVTVCPR